MIALLDAIVRLAEEDGHGKFDPLKIEWGAAFWTWAIFLLALFPMWKVVFGPITQALRARDLRAEEAIARAESAKSAAESARDETEKQLEEARVQAQRQIRDARERAERQASQLLEKARQEADADRARAVAEIEAEKRRALAEIRDLTVEISLDAASRLIRRDIKGEDQKKFVQSFLADVEVMQKS